MTRWHRLRPTVALTMSYAALYPLVVLDPPGAPFGPAWVAVVAFGLAVVMCIAGFQVFRMQSRPDAPWWTQLVGAAHAVVVAWAAVSVGFLFLALIAQAPGGLPFLAMGTLLSIVTFFLAVVHFWLGGVILFYALPFLYVAMLLAFRRGTLPPARAA